MGHQTIIYGQISGATWKYEDHDKLHRLNTEVINALPDMDAEFPFLNRSMFAIPNEQGTYGEQVIAFGASYKSLEYEWHSWLHKFESLLQKLYWVDVIIHAEFEVMGNFTYKWFVNHELIRPNWHQEPLQPIADWQFESNGPRSFEEELGK